MKSKEQVLSKYESGIMQDLEGRNYHAYTEKDVLEAMQEYADQNRFTPVKAAQDDSGHWYVIPNNLYERFVVWSISDPDAIDPDEFNEYRTNGDLNLVQMYIPKPPHQ